MSSSTNEAANLETTTQHVSKCYQVNNTNTLDYLEEARYVTLGMWLVALYLFVILVVYKVKYSHSRSKRTVTVLMLGIVPTTFISWTTQILELWFCCFFKCSVYRWVNAASYFTNNCCFYSIIWYYQHQLYSDPRLSESKSKRLKIINFSLIFAIFLTYVIAVPAYLNNYKLCKTNHGCFLLWNPETVTSVVIPITVTSLISTITFRIGLLALIIRPLLHRLTEVDERRNRLTFRRHIESDIKNLLLRLGVCTLISLTTAVVIYIVVMLNAMKILRIYTSNWYGLELILNTLAINCLFSNWKYRLFPFLQ